MTERIASSKEMAAFYSPPVIYLFCPLRRGKSVTKTLSGVIAAIATPIDENGAPDLKRAVNLARFLLNNGCDGLNVLGTTGEATSFSVDERKGVMDAYKADGLPLHPVVWWGGRGPRVCRAAVGGWTRPPPG